MTRVIHDPPAPHSGVEEGGGLRQLAKSAGRRLSAFLSRRGIPRQRGQEICWDLSCPLYQPLDARLSANMQCVTNAAVHLVGVGEDYRTRMARRGLGRPQAGKQLPLPHVPHRTARARRLSGH